MRSIELHHKLHFQNLHSGKSNHVEISALDPYKLKSQDCLDLSAVFADEIVFHNCFTSKLKTSNDERIVENKKREIALAVEFYVVRTLMFVSDRSDIVLQNLHGVQAAEARRRFVEGLFSGSSRKRNRAKACCGRSRKRILEICLCGSKNLYRGSERFRRSKE